MRRETTYQTTLIDEGNHASILIPAENLAAIGGNKRAPLKVTVNGHTYQSTATGVAGTCQVVFPMRDRAAAGVTAGDTITVHLVLDDGYRQVPIPPALQDALVHHKLSEAFHDLTYSKRREYCRLVDNAKTDATRQRRITKIIEQLATR